MNKKRLPMSQIAPGMILAEDIANAAGVTLMPKGIRLTPMFISRLAKWDVKTIEVTLPEQEAEEPAPAHESSGSRTIHAAQAGQAITPEQEEFVKSVTREVSSWFQNLRDDPLMMQLRVLAIKKLVSIGPNAMLNQLRMAAGDEGDGT